MPDTRRMTPALEAAIDALAGDKSVIRALDELAAGDTPLARLWLGLRAELMTVAARDAAMLADLERDHREYVDEVDRRVNGDPPPVAGNAAWFDPDTREWTAKGT